MDVFTNKNFFKIIKKFQQRKPFYGLHHNIIHDFLTKKIFRYTWASSVISNNHQECWFKKQYTINDVNFEECECNAYLYNYLTCIFQEIAENCPDTYLKNSTECVERFKGIEKNLFRKKIS